MPRCICSSIDGIYTTTLYLNVEIIRDDEFNGSNALLKIDLKRYTTLFISNSLEGIRSIYAYYINKSQSFLLDEIISLESSFGKLKGVFIDANQNKHLVFEKEKIPAYYFYKMLRTRNFNRLEHFMSLLGGMLLNNMKYNRLDFDLIMRVRDLKLFKTEDEL